MYDVPLIVHATRLLESMVVASSITSSASGKHSSKLEHIPYNSRLREEEKITITVLQSAIIFLGNFLKFSIK